MTIKDNLTEDFLLGINEIENILLQIGFHPYSFEKKGLAYFIQYKNEENIVEFFLGPSDWDIEMIIYTAKGKFAFRDLLQIPSIAIWVNGNRYRQESVRDIKKELLWFVELLKVSLKCIA